MRRLILAAILAIPPAPLLALEPEQIFERVSPGVFTIRTFDADRKSMSQGSGVVIAPQRVITNCHVVAKARYIVVMREKTQLLATLELPDPERDLCQLAVPKLDAPVIAIGQPQALRIGQRVYAIGNPRGLELTMSEGIVSALRAGRQGQLIQTTAAISRGSSGGGLFDADGRLVGITTRTVADGQNLNIAIPSSWIAELPERAKVVLERAKQQVPPVAQLTDILPAPVRVPAGGTPVAPGGAGAAPAPVPGTAVKPGATPESPSAGVAVLPPNFPRAGDTWTYAHIDQRFRPDDRSRLYVHTVRSSSPDAIVEEVTHRDAVIATHTHVKEAVARWRAGVLEIAPFLAAFRRPMAGERFNALPVEGSAPVSLSAGEHAIVLQEGRTEQPDRVTLAGGTWDTTKVQWRAGMARGWINPGAGANGYESGTITVWYAPAARRAVRITIEGPGIAESYELVSLRFGK